MAQQFQTSFIPKKTVVPKQKRSGGGFGFFTLAAVIIFILSIAGAVGVFLYKATLETSLEKKKEHLERSRAAFEPSLIETMADFDRKLMTAGDVLDAHIVPGRIFDLLEASTLVTVQFRSLQYSLREGIPVIKMTGVAESFSSVALQSDAFAESKMIINPVFSNLGFDSDGLVTFSVEAELDSSVIDFVVGTNGVSPVVEVLSDES